MSVDGGWAPSPQDRRVWGPGPLPPVRAADPAGPPPPAPRSSNTGALITLLGGGGGLAVLIVIAILVTSGVLADDERRSAADRLAAAAQRLAGVRAVALRGLVSSGSDRLDGDLKVTRGGRMTGTVTWSGQRVRLIAIGGVMYVRAGAEFWRREGDVTRKAMWINDRRWGLLGPTTIDTTVRHHLTPEAIARKLAEVGRYTVKDTARTSVRGAPAVKINTSTGSFYVSADGPPRLLRLETGYPEVAVDVTEPAGADGGAVVAELRARIKQLNTSFDPSQRTRVTELAWGSCTATGCTVRSDVWSSRGEASSIRVTAFVRLTAGSRSGRRLGECTGSGTVTSDRAVRVTCRVTGTAWSDFWHASGLRRWWGHAEAMAGGATDAEIRAMLNGLDSE